MKNFFKTLFFISLATLLLFVVLTVISAVSAVSSPSGSAGIIGGADGPTAIFVTQALIFKNPLFSVLFLSAVLCVASAIGWAKAKKR